MKHLAAWTSLVVASLMTPWVMAQDYQYPTQFFSEETNFAARVNLALKPGGRWINTGSLAFSRAAHADRIGLDEVRELAGEYNLVPLRHTFIADCETPVSAYLKLRGGGQSFLLESAEQGRLGRYSFIGLDPILSIRACGGEGTVTGDIPDDVRGAAGTGGAPGAEPRGARPASGTGRPPPHLSEPAPRATRRAPPRPSPR